MQIRLGLLPTVVLLNLFSYVHAANFTFQYGDATSCGPFQVSWAGGSPPFQLTLVPVFGSPRSINIPTTSFSNGNGSFSTTIPFPKDQKFLVSMSDATGYGSGGVSSLTTVKAAVDKNSCNVTDPGVDFFFELNTALDQCRPFTFSGYDGAVQPVTITGVIPGGSTFILNPPSGPSTFDWVANVAAGTSILWLLSDSKGRTGGSSDVKIVGVSDDKTCLTGTPPASASVFPSHTKPATAHASASGSAAPSALPASGANVGLIAGLSIAGVFGLTAIILVVLFLRKRKRNKYGFSHRVDLMDPPPGPADDHTAPPINPYPFAMSSHGSSHGGSVAYGGAPPSSHNLLSDHDAGSISPPLTNPYSGYAPTSLSGSDPRQSYHDDPFAAATSSGPRSPRAYPPSTNTSSTGRTKAQIAGMHPYKPARYILHTDLEEVGPPDEAEEVIELPPQYSETRAPLDKLASPPARGAVPDIALTPATPASPSRPVNDVLR